MPDKNEQAPMDRFREERKILKEQQEESHKRISEALSTDIYADIEKEEPGITKKLIETFGIRAPALYGKHALFLLAKRGDWLLDWHKNPKELLHMWEENSSPQKELQQVSALKNTYEDLPRTLHNDSTIGIVYFSRYMPQTLIKLYEQRMKNDKRFVLLMLPSVDRGPNNSHAFAYMSYKIEILRQELEDQELYLRIMEVHSPKQALQRLSKLRQRFAGKDLPEDQRHLSAGTFIGGHGSKGFIQLGENLTQEMTQRDLFKQAVRRYTEPGSEIALISCYTGEPQGMAESVHKKTRRKTIGPSDKASINKLGATVAADGHVHLSIQYGGAASVEYGAKEV